MSFVCEPLFRLCLSIRQTETYAQNRAQQIACVFVCPFSKVHNFGTSKGEEPERRLWILSEKQTFGVFAGLCWCIFRSSTEVKQRPCLKGELPTPKTKPATNPPADLIPHTQVAMGKPQLVVDLNSFLRKCNSSRIPGFSRCLTLAGGIL